MQMSHLLVHFPHRAGAPPLGQALTSATLSTAFTPGAMAPAEARPRGIQRQVVLVAHAGVGLLADELHRGVLIEAHSPPVGFRPGAPTTTSWGPGNPFIPETSPASPTHLDDQGFRGGATGMELLRCQVPLSAPLVVQDGTGHGQGSGGLDGPVPIEVVLTTDALHRCAG